MNRNRKPIRLTESQLNRVIRESVMQVLNEYNTDRRAPDYYPQKYENDDPYLTGEGMNMVDLEQAIGAAGNNFTREINKENWKNQNKGKFYSGSVLRRNDDIEKIGKPGEAAIVYPDYSVKYAQGGMFQIINRRTKKPLTTDSGCDKFEDLKRVADGRFYVKPKNEYWQMIGDNKPFEPWKKSDTIYYQY